jgi:hypothetical protein
LRDRPKYSWAYRLMDGKAGGDTDRRRLKDGQIDKLTNRQIDIRTDERTD